MEVGEDVFVSSVTKYGCHSDHLFFGGKLVEIPFEGTIRVAPAVFDRNGFPTR